MEAQYIGTRRDVSLAYCRDVSEVEPGYRMAKEAVPWSRLFLPIRPRRCSGRMLA